MLKYIKINSMALIFSSFADETRMLKLWFDIFSKDEVFSVFSDIFVWLSIKPASNIWLNLVKIFSKSYSLKISQTVFIN